MIIVPKRASVETPPANMSVLYVKSDGKWYQKDDAGNELPLQGQQGVQGEPGLVPSFPGFTSGRYYGSSLSYGGGTGTLPSSTPRHWAAPFFVPRDVAIDRIGLEVTTAGVGGTTGYCALYDSTAAGLPGTRLAVTSVLALDSTGGKDSAVAVDLEGPALYWLSFIASAGCTIRSYSFDRALLGNGSLLDIGSWCGYYRTEASFVEPPADFGVISSVASSLPRVVARAA